MLQSHIIDIDGVFVGAAIRLDRGYRFVATNLRVEELDESIWPTLADVQRLARRLYVNGSFAEQSAPHVNGSFAEQSAPPTRPARRAVA